MTFSAGPPGRTIVIVGAGFSGTATAVQLLRRASTRPLRVVLIERGPEHGRGAAYARSDYPVLLNVPASRMSATMSDPDEFLRYLRRRDQQASGDAFVPRALYGDYLQELLDSAAARAAPGVRLERVRDEVVDIESGDIESEFRPAVALESGGRIVADAVVLASGAPHAQARAADPAMAGRRSVLVVGTGLTMVDVAWTSAHLDPDTTIHALSRHGLLPLPQSAFRPDALHDDAGLLAMSAGSTARLVKAARRLAEECQLRGGDWREVITLIRRQAPALWRSLPLQERRRFFRHVRVYWDVHRHRLPGQVLALVEQLRATGRLIVHAGRLTSMSNAAAGVRVAWTPRGSRHSSVLEVGHVVYCTGYSPVGPTAGRLWRALMSRGLARVDELQLGIRTGACGALIGLDGTASNRLFYVGPMLRADYWEATAVAELRMHAERLARHLAQLQALDDPAEGRQTVALQI